MQRTSAKRAFSNRKSQIASRKSLMQERGVEPLHLSVQDPKSCASANSATPARVCTERIIAEARGRRRLDESPNAKSTRARPDGEDHDARIVRAGSSSATSRPVETSVRNCRPGQ